MKQSPGHKTGFALLLAALVALIITPTVLAHTILLRSDPADNAILAQPPPEVRLWFSEAISPHFSGAQILDISGRPVEGVRIRVNPAENLLILTPPKLPEGLYSVRWKILSEADGHFSQGLLVFGVGEHVNLSSAAPAQVETPFPLPEMGLRWLNFTTLLILVGSVLMAYTVLQAAPTPSGAHEAAVNALRRSAQRRVLVVALSCNGLGLLVGIALLGWQISVLFNTLAAGASPFEVGWQLVGHTRWGWFWLLRQSVLLALLPLLFRLLYRLPRPKIIWLAASLLLLTL
ncbi:MAG: copper resistance protein CopC, partial [Anaerolineae bacterium]